MRSDETCRKLLEAIAALPLGLLAECLVYRGRRSPSGEKKAKTRPA